MVWLPLSLGMVETSSLLNLFYPGGMSEVTLSAFYFLSETLGFGVNLEEL